ncbi:hypothetical protein GCM10011571_22680 [Marinithermofilum abyssi]|uniref:Uncharacterized protein n=1 Tax=Marinithermofilum abyssi TaxID=1571185 RepID=A0A8J2VIG7_9BACL|nr:hypothetical protein GCM10011571_22680 [Marinithermofilum abyssi]
MSRSKTRTEVRAKETPNVARTSVLRLFARHIVQKSRLRRGSVSLRFLQEIGDGQTGPSITNEQTNLRQKGFLPLLYNR